MLADRIIANLAIAGLAVYLYILGEAVPRAALVIVLIVVTLMAAYDFWRALRPRRTSGSLD